MTSERYVCMHFISGFFQPVFLFLCIHRVEGKGNANSLPFYEKKPQTIFSQNPKTIKNPQRVEHSATSENQEFY